MFDSNKVGVIESSIQNQQSKIDKYYSSRHFSAMLKMAYFLLLLVSALSIQNHSKIQPACPCKNRGKCLKGYFQSTCQCPTQYIGKYCQTKAQLLEDSPQYMSYNYNFTHFVFAPEAPNSFKFTFEVCMLHNPQELDTLIFMTSDQDDGSPSYQPTIFSSAKIRVKEGTCQTFTSPYIQIRHHVTEPFCRIIIALKAIPKLFKNIFYRTVPGKNLRPLPQQILQEQPLTYQNFTQKVHFSFTYEVYKETITEAAVRIFVKALIGAGISLALCLFCKIALFSYGIDTNHILLYFRRTYRIIKRKVFPGRDNLKTYENYIRLRSGAREQGQPLRSEECAICLQLFEMEDIIQQTQCKHIYHENCLQVWWLKNEICPMCRQPLQKDSEQESISNVQSI